MAGLLGYAAAGAAAGLGAGLVEEGKAARERFMKSLDQQFQRDLLYERDELQSERERERDERIAQREEQRDERTATRQREMDEARFKREGGMLQSVQQLEDGTLIGITRSGQRVDLGVVGAPKRDPEPLVEVEDPDDPDRTIMLPRSKAAGMPGKSTPDQRAARREREAQEREEARRQAEKEASERAGWFSTDSSDFKDDGGSRSAFIERRTNEILAARKGKGAAKTSEGRPIVKNEDGSVSTERTITVTDERINGGKPTNIPTMFGGKQVSEEEAIERIARAGGKDPETGRPLPGYNSIEEAVKAAKERSENLGRQYGDRQEARPSGSGSREDPFRATSQADVDWFRQNAPPGSVIEVNGKLYTKK
jgi:hypothetical protein